MKKAKIKNSALQNTYELCGLKDIDIFYKITGLQCFWVRNFHEWKNFLWEILIFILLLLEINV